MQQLSGNIQGLSPSDRKLLERIWRRRVDPHYIVSPELAAFLCECSRELGRQVGVLIDRRGAIEHVIVGDHQSVMIPDLGPRRAGQSRLRGVRLVHTHLRAESLTRDDLLDLAKLRLDLVAAILMNPAGQMGPMEAAHLLPPNPENETWRVLPAASAAEVSRGHDLDFLELMRALEEEFAATGSQLRDVGDGKDRAVLVFPTFGKARSPEETEIRQLELKELCRTAGVNILDVVSQRRADLDPRYLVGRGKLEDVVLRALQYDATLLVFDHDLTPAQARTISEATELKVLDRTMLILDIFAQHAKSRDGKLQVELAQLKYALPRLQDKDTMMSRLTGGIGGRGPGETKLEINRRRAREKINLLEKEIEELGKRRDQRRNLRDKSELPIVSIVGYTNAGKSTLLNALTHGDVLVANKLFATLDPTSRRLRFPSEREIIITDTVGFIRDLPKELINAFRATLEELEEADLLVHVVDASDRARENHIRSVEKILTELKLSDKPRIIVYNKIDRLSPEDRAALEGVKVSAKDESSLHPLLEAIEQQLWREDKLQDAPPPRIISSSEPL